MSDKISDKNVTTEEDIKVLKNIEKLRCIEFKHYVTDREIKAIQNILAEREQDKERVKELEKELEKANRQLDLDYVDENFIPRQVVKDVLQNNRNELFGVTYLSKEQYKPYEMQIERINKIEQELLEGER